MRNSMPFLVLFFLYFNFNASSQSIANHSPVNSDEDLPVYSPTTADFMKTWLLGGPVALPKDSAGKADASAQEKFFNRTDSAAQLDWKRFSSTSDMVVFDSLFPGVDYATVYASAVIASDRDMDAVLGIGSDDAVKVILNGKTVHKNFVARGLNADDDIVPVQLKKGNNRLTIAVQDIEGGWGFMARFLDKKELTEQLIKAASTGKAEDIRLLKKSGADPYLKGSTGINAVQAAKLAGRKGAERLLNPSERDIDVPSGGVLVDSMYASVGRQLRPGIAILVSKGGKVLYEKGFAYADIEKKKKITPLTKFRIGSITKQFTAATILQLQQEGKLSVQDKISKYFPDFPRGNEVTIHHLLTHTSGIHSYTNTDSFMRKVTKPVTGEALYAMIKTYPYDFNPGEKYQYNNSGYFLLGYLAEKLSGKALTEIFRERFFEPLKMNNTGIYHSDNKPQNEALGYGKSGDKYDTAIDWDMTWAAGAGALYSTVEDLDKWNNALHHGKVLSAANYKAAITPVVLNNGSKPPGTDYGYGLGMGNYRGVQSIGHSGGLNGFISQLVWYPKEELTVVMLTNQSPPELMLDPNRIAEMFLWSVMDTAETYDRIDVNSMDLTVYEGKYDVMKSLIMEITTEGKSIFAQLTGQQRFEIFPSKKDEFFFKVVEAKIRFNRNEKGEVVSAFLEQGGFTATAPKMKAEVQNK